MKNISCVREKIKIQKAIFRRTEAKKCPGENDIYCVVDVTDKIKKFCEDKESCVGCVIQGISKDSISPMLQVQQVFANQQNMRE